MPPVPQTPTRSPPSPVRLANPRATILLQNLAAAWYPGLGTHSRRPPSLLPRRTPTDVNVNIAAGPGGLAYRDPVTTSLGFPYLPVAGGERPFTVAARVAIRSLEYTEFFRQYQTGQADRCILSANASGRLDWNHPTQLAGSIYLTVNRVHTVAVTEHPSGPQRTFVDGLPCAAGLTSLGRASPVNSAWSSSGSIDIYAFWIFTGLALTAHDIRELHADPSLFFRPRLYAPATAIAAAVSRKRKRNPNYAHMPNRPWWRRWAYRKLQ